MQTSQEMNESYYRRTTSIESVDNQWKHALDFIQDLFVEQNQDGGIVVRNQNYQDITRSHWKANSSKCSRESCSKLFNLFERPHHCRRCGNIFCSTCVSYEKRLNLLARPDLGGRLYKVCLECFDEGPQAFGQSRDWGDIFCQMSRCKRSINGVLSNVNVNNLQPSVRVNISNYRDRMNIEKECQRLMDGFKDSLSTGLMTKVLHDFGMKEHLWKRSSFWVYINMTTRCCINLILKTMLDLFLYANRPVAWSHCRIWSLFSSLWEVPACRSRQRMDFSWTHLLQCRDTVRQICDPMAYALTAQWHTCSCTKSCHATIPL